HAAGRGSVCSAERGKSEQRGRQTDRKTKCAAPASGCHSGYGLANSPFPLTPTLSLGERVEHRALMKTAESIQFDVHFTSVLWGWFSARMSFTGVLEMPGGGSNLN